MTFKSEKLWILRVCLLVLVTVPCFPLANDLAEGVADDESNQGEFYRPQDQGFISLLGGTRILWDPGLEKYARGPNWNDPLVRNAPLGPSISATFGYWASTHLLYGLDLGGSINTHTFKSGRSLSVMSLSAAAAVRWAPFAWSTVIPYLGASAGYFYTSSKIGSAKADDANIGGGGMVGVLVMINRRVALMVEGRGMISQEAKAPETLGVAGGGFYLLGGLAMVLDPNRRPGESFQKSSAHY